MSSKANNKTKGWFPGGKWSFLVMMTIIVFALALTWSKDLGTAEATRVLAGISVPGRDLSNVGREEGVAALRDLEAVMAEWVVTIRLDDQTWPATPAELGFSLNAETTMDRALAVRDQFNTFERLQSHFYPVNRLLCLDVEIDEDVFAAYLAGITAGLTGAPVDATLNIRDDDTVEILPGRPGRTLETEQAKAYLADALSQGQVPDLHLELVVQQPAVTVEQITALGIERLVGKTSTTFKEPSGPRAHNVRTAAAKLDRLLLGPGQELSFNEVVGPRSAERGYRTAPVIIGNKFDEGLGGGVCQVSSTLYKAALLANMAVVERHNHSLAVSYIDLGLDAAVAYGLLDLVMRNDYPGHLLFKTEVKGNVLTVKVFGSAPLDREISLTTAVTSIIEPEIIYTPDPELLPGEEQVLEKGARGYRAKAARLVSKGGQVVSREELPNSYYRPLNREVLQGEDVETIGTPGVEESGIPDVEMGIDAEEADEAAELQLS